VITHCGKYQPTSNPPPYDLRVTLKIKEKQSHYPSSTSSFNLPEGENFVSRSWEDHDGVSFSVHRIHQIKVTFSKIKKKKLFVSFLKSNCGYKHIIL